MTDRLTAFHYRRKTPVDYAHWFAEHIGVEGIVLDRVPREKERIEDLVLSLTAPHESEIQPTTEAPEPVESAEDIPNSEDFPAELSYDAMTLVELREECKRRGLPYYGTKAEIALRLKRDDEGIEESTPTPEAPDEESAAEEEVDAPADEAAATEVEMNEDSERQDQTAETEE
jgi:hypothetical protein